ncbi:MAG: NEW3 domain-containing protein [Dehalococcoidia bacterium]
MRRFQRTLVSLAAVLLLTLAGASSVMAQTPEDIEVDAPHRGIAIDAGETEVSLEIVLFNHTDDGIPVGFEVLDVPDGWNVGVWEPRMRFLLDELMVEPSGGDPEEYEFVRLRIGPPSSVEPGEYEFRVRVQSPDGSVAYEEATYTVSVRGEESEGSGDISVRADIPSLQGPPGSTLGYEVVIENRLAETPTDEELAEEDPELESVSFDLSAEAPSGWEVEFVEPTGDQRVLGAVSVAHGFNEHVGVNVTPPASAELGEYTIIVTGDSPEGQVSIELQALISGDGQLEIGEQSQLSRSVSAGRAATANLVLVNPGTAELSDIQLRTEAPEGWDVEIGHTDATIASLPRGNEIIVPLTVTPPSDTPGGDYLVTLWAEHQDAEISADVRVTVTEQNLWGWAGLGVLVLVVGGTVVLFMKLGRR